MKITKNDFEAYLSVQKSGVTNMFAVNVVSQLSGLSREQIFDIMKNYEKYETQFGINIATA
jgi:hypothetical protein